MNYRGYYSDGVTAQRHPVRVMLSSNALSISHTDSNQLLASWPLKSLQLSEEVYPGQPIRLQQTGEDARLTLDEHTILESLLKVAPHLHRRHLAKTPMGQQVIFWMLVLAIIVPALLYGIPKLAGPLAKIVPHEWERTLGESIVEGFMAESPACSSPEGDKALEALVAPLRAQVALPYPLNIQVIDNTETNAFATPGGNIVIFRGLLTFSESPDEVAGVLAHEMAHVIKQHPTEGLIRAVGFSLVFSALFGDASALMSAAGEMGSTLLTLSYSRDAEKEADRIGLQLLQQAELTTTGLKHFFQRLQKAKKELPESLAILSTHPMTEDRVKVAASYINTGKSALDPVQWQHLRTICPEDNNNKINGL